MFLKFGSTGDDVKFVQYRLKLKPDGIFGEKTEKAVKEFQAKKYLKVDGIVGTKTFEALSTNSISKQKSYENQGVYDFEGYPNLFLYDSKKIWLIDPGHGGIINGEYVTPGKRSPSVPPGVYEGVVNREVADKLINLLKQNNISCGLVVHEQEDVSLRERIRRANKTQERYLNCMYISIHQNAYKTRWNRARGIETYYHREDSKDIAETFQSNLISLTERLDRGVKKARFYVLRETKMPSILTENGFMTNKEEAQLLSQPHYQHIIAHAHFNSICQIEKKLGNTNI